MPSPSYVSASSNTATSTNTLTVSHTAGGGSNRKLLVLSAWESGTTFTSLTYNGSSSGVTQIGSQQTSSNDKIRCYYIDEATLVGGAVDIVMTLSASTSSLRMAVIEIADAKQGGPNTNGGSSLTSGTAIETSITPTVDGCFVVVGVIASTGSRSSDNAGQNLRVSLAAASPRFYCSTEVQATAGAEAFGYTWSAGVSNAVVYAVAIEGLPLGGNFGGPTRGLLRGVSRGVVR